MSYNDFDVLKKSTARDAQNVHCGKSLLLSNVDQSGSTWTNLKERCCIRSIRSLIREKNRCTYTQKMPRVTTELLLKLRDYLGNRRTGNWNSAEI